MRELFFAVCLLVLSAGACFLLVEFPPAPSGFGEDAGAVAQIAHPVTATVLLYPADGEAVLVDVDVIPGVWLVPEDVFQQPKEFECE